MKLYDIGEMVEDGWPISVDMQRRETFLSLSNVRGDDGAELRLLFHPHISNVLLDGANPLQEKDFKYVVLAEGAIAHYQEDFCVMRPQQEDQAALLRVCISPGEGGTIKYSFGKDVDVIAEGSMGFDETRFPVYVLVMPEGSSFTVERTGDLGGYGDLKMRFTWDGAELVRLPG